MSNNSSHITLLAPGCFAALAEPESSAAPSAAEPVTVDINDAQACETSTHCYEQALLKALGQTADAPGELAIAQHRYKIDMNATAPDHCVCAELVHLQADTSNARLFPQSALDLNTEDTDRLVQSVNDLVGDDGLTLSRMQNGNLYFTGMPATHLDTWPAHALASGKVANYLPRQSEAGDWRRLLTEVQMLFHSHPVNEARVANNQLPVNAIWFWGGQKLVAQPVPAVTKLVADDEFSRGIASALGIECTSATSMPTGPSKGCTHLVMVDLSVYKAWLSGDSDALREAKKTLHDEWIEFAQQTVAHGMFDQFTLDGCEGQSIVETAKSSAGGFSSGVQSIKNVFNKVLGKTPSAGAGKHH